MAEPACTKRGSCINVHCCTALIITIILIMIIVIIAIIIILLIIIINFMGSFGRTQQKEEIKIRRSR